MPVDNEMGQPMTQEERSKQWKEFAQVVSDLDDQLSHENVQIRIPHRVQNLLFAEPGAVVTKLL